MLTMPHRLSLHIGATLAVLSGCLAFSSPAFSQIGVFGSAQRVTGRTCVNIAADADCQGAPFIGSVYGGGLGEFGETRLDLANGSYAASTVSFGALALPQISGATLSVGQERMNINAFGFQTYTFTGAAGTPFSLTADLHIDDSSTNPVSYLLPGGAGYSGYVAIWDPAALSGLTTARQLFDKLFFAGCGSAGVLGAGSGGGGLPGGEQRYSVSTEACSSTSLLLTPGQQVLAVAGLQLPTNRGGFVDATRTFTTKLDTRLSASNIAELTSNLIPAGIAAVPEPATWAMMLCGFGAIGASVRLRRRSGGMMDRLVEPSA